jgi:hypothetical protein
MSKPISEQQPGRVPEKGAQGGAPAQVTVDLSKLVESDAIGFANRCSIIEHPTYWELLLFHASPAGHAAVARLILPLDLAYGTLVLQSEGFAKTLRAQISGPVGSEKFVVVAKKTPDYADIVPVQASVLTIQQAGMTAAISAYFVVPSSVARAQQSGNAEDIQVKGLFTIQVPIGLPAQLIEFALERRDQLEAAATAAMRPNT